MQRLATTSVLGPALRNARKGALFSQVRLAKAASISRNTLQRLERGQGYLGSFFRVAETLGIEIRPRGLGPASLGSVLRSIRNHRHLTVATVAGMLNTSPASVRRVEGNRSTHIKALEAYAQLLGVELYVGKKRGAPEVSMLP